MNNIRIRRFLIPLMLGLLLFFGAAPSGAGILVQCPGDKDGDAAWGSGGETQPPNTKCMHITAGDGFVTMGDGEPKYIFSFADVTGMPTKTRKQKDAMMAAGMLSAESPAPTIVLSEGDDFYLTLTNVGMMIRPDLFDPHTVHYHGFPQAASVFDGVPDASISINMGSSLTYYYKNIEPGTYMYHCHVEATEHMQMGMLGNLYVLPDQDGTSLTYAGNGRTYIKFVYNDGDGSTGYDVAFPIQIGSFDGAFHDASETVQPLPFALMVDNYPMLNGRGYPDTVSLDGPDPPTDANPINGVSTQPVSSLIEANAGETILLRISNLNITRYYTLQSLGIPMRVVGKDARQLKGPTGLDLSYTTNSVMLGGGESFDVILDTAGVNPGTYYLYTSNLNYLSNDADPGANGGIGGMMTEIRIN
jgi:FtsP/CotA-like multicopper oxidase with cupredoxin domain